ncbi:unnamed protein product [Symbiodinium sp. KB8]|nr:unnamed protein product [Symbiodinium sp. KB8]
MASRCRLSVPICHQLGTDDRNVMGMNHVKRFWPPCPEVEDEEEGEVAKLIQRLSQIALECMGTPEKVPTSEPALGHRLVHQVAQNQKTSAEACLKAVEKALNTDSGPLEELIEAQQQARSVKSNGGSTRRSRGAKVAAQVQTWDVLEEAQGLLNALKSGEAKGDTNSAEAMQVLKRLGDEAAKQLDVISSTHVKEAKVQEKPEQKDAGCQTIFRLGGMAWHANPAVQKLLEELMKAGGFGWLKAGACPVSDQLCAAMQVFRFLHRAGGSADAHYVTGKYGCKKQWLLEFEGGNVFEAEGDKLKLKGGAFAVAAAAAAAGRVSRKAGRRSSPAHLLTKAGFATKEEPARRLQQRIEGLLMSAGDGVLPFEAVLRALALKPSHALNRWLPKAGFRMTPNGDLWVDSYRLFHFRLYRTLRAAAFIMEKGGEAPLQELMEFLYRPSELQDIEEVELTPEGRQQSYEAGLAPSAEVEEWRLAARERYWRKAPGEPAALLPAPKDTLEFSDNEEQLFGDDEALERLELSEEALEFEIMLAERYVDPPLWLEAWLREYFVVEDDLVYLPFLKPWKQHVARNPDAPPPLSHTEQEALLMNIQEEMRLRYGRVHIATLGPLFPGAKRGWMKRFFDITSYGDLLEKSVARQTREAIAVAARIHYEDYTSVEAFFDFGIGREWLRRYFCLDPDTNKLSLDHRRYASWEPPPKDPEAPDPRIYTKLNAPRGYVRKGNGKYAKRKYGHFAGPTADPEQVDKLDDEVSVIMEKWRKTFIERNRQRGNSLRRQQPPEIHAMPPAQVPAAAPTAPQAPPVMLEADLVARAAAKKLEAPPPEAPAWSSVKRDEVKMTVEPSSFQSSTFDSSLPGRMPEAEVDTSRQGSDERSTSPGVRAPTSGRIPHSSEHRRPRAGSEDAQVPSPEKSGQSSEPLASRSRRRRDSESSNFQRDVSGGSVPSCSETPLHPGMPEQAQAGSSEAKTDVLAQLGQIRQSQHAPSSRAASKEEFREDPPTGRPSSAVGHRGGPGDSSLLVPPARDASRSVSPSSSVGSSSVSSGHRRPVLDPIARPRGPPLPSAGRLLLATAQQESRETSPHSARSGPAAP